MRGGAPGPSATNALFGDRVRARRPGPPRFRALSALTLFAVLAAAGPPAAAESGRFQLGLRANVVGADGEPANDLLGAGLYGRYPLSDRWRLGLALDHSPGFDVERPYEFLGFAGDPAAGEIDADGTATNLVAWIERVHGRPEGRREWFWAVGGGVGLVEVDPITGPLAGGGTYAIDQDVGTELLALAMGGLRIRLGRGWAFEAALRLEQHVTDWTVTDRISGATVALDDYLVRGLHLGMAYRF